MSNLEIFIQAYIQCSLWATHSGFMDENENDLPLDKFHHPNCVQSSVREQVKLECEDFLKREDVSPITEKWGKEEYQRAGHDFFLTRNHHGGGFWDGSWPEPDGDILTNASHEAGSSEPYVGDDGEIYFS